MDESERITAQLARRIGGARLVQQGVLHAQQLTPQLGAGPKRDGRSENQQQRQPCTQPKGGVLALCDGKRVRAERCGSGGSLRVSLLTTPLTTPLNARDSSPLTTAN